MELCALLCEGSTYKKAATLAGFNRAFDLQALVRQRNCRPRDAKLSRQFACGRQRRIQWNSTLQNRTAQHTRDPLLQRFGGVTLGKPGLPQLA
jgi:hypothetical protein